MIRRLILAAVIAHFLVSAWAAGAQYAHPAPSLHPPAGCVIWREWEDGSAIAICNGGASLMAHDPDGQPYENVAGVPVRRPGWYPYRGSLWLMPDADWRRELG